MRLVRIVAVIAVFGGFALACGDEASSAVEDFVLPEREHATYDDSALPRAELPEDASLALADTLTPPLQLQGEDTGDAGIFYAAALGGYHLIKIQQPDGAFGYQYDHRADRWAEDNSFYRQAGTTYTQAWLATLTERPEFTLSTEWALRSLSQQLTAEPDGSMKMLDIGGTGLLMLSMTEHATYTGDTRYDDTLRACGEYLLKRVADDGRFTESVPLQWGQAMQALWRLYVYFDDARYLDALERAGRYLYEHPELSGEEDEYYILTLWINEPLTWLYTERPNAWITDLVFRLTDFIVARQYTPENAEAVGWIGSYIMPEADNEPSWRAALRLEGVIDALRLAQLSGDAERVERYTESTLLATHYLLGLQLRAGDTRGAARPELVTGAFPFDAESPQLRIDVTHHIANTLIKVVSYLKLEDFPGEAP